VSESGDMSIDGFKELVGDRGNNRSTSSGKDPVTLVHYRLCVLKGHRLVGPNQDNVSESGDMSIDGLLLQ
jgi:hypothetical protein